MSIEWGDDTLGQDQRKGEKPHLHHMLDRLTAERDKLRNQLSEVAKSFEPTKAEKQLRDLLVNNGRNAANNREGIKLGSPLHLAEMMLIQIEQGRRALGS